MYLLIFSQLDVLNPCRRRHDIGAKFSHQKQTCNNTQASLWIFTFSYFSFVNHTFPLWNKIIWIWSMILTISWPLYGVMPVGYLCTLFGRRQIVCPPPPCLSQWKNQSNNQTMPFVWDDINYVYLPLEYERQVLCFSQKLSLEYNSGTGRASMGWGRNMKSFLCSGVHIFIRKTSRTK